MLAPLSPLTLLRAALLRGQSPMDLTEQTAARANENASRNTYLHFDPDEVKDQAAALQLRFPTAGERPALYGVPISLKDCFDLAGTRTSCGSRFYAARSVAAQDSAMAKTLRQAGALITGKTHLHPLAYGITGQNPDYGDCLQPRDATVLTGGSSSGAAASVQEGSALAAIGTDTGGSIRVPAALCGLVGYRASHQLATTIWPDAWTGGAHLAPSFDTVGFLLRDPRDAAPIAEALFAIQPGTAPAAPRIGLVSNAFLHDAESEVLSAFTNWQHTLAGTGAHFEPFAADAWQQSLEIFAGIQAHEAAEIHRGNFEQFEPAIRERLQWGASLSAEAIAALQQRLTEFRGRMQHLFERYDLLMLPAAPVSRLRAGADLSDARRIILRYTTPFSLAGLPAISLPGELIGAPFGTGVQIAAAPGQDAMLLAYAAHAGRAIAQQL